MSDTLIPFFRFEELNNDINKLKVQLSMLLLERDELIFVVCKNIESTYCLKFGALEYKAYKAQCTALRLKRKIELVQAKINRQEKIEVNLIEKVLDQEFAHYKKKLDEQIHRMNDAIERSRCKTLTIEETKEIKRLYRGIVKILHPDVNPNATDEQMRLFNNAVEAYKNGNIEELRLISTMIADSYIPDANEDAATSLIKEKNRLESILAILKKEIDKVKSEYPYNLKDIIENAEKEQQQREKLQNIIQTCENMTQLYNARLDEMLR